MELDARKAGTRLRRTRSHLIAIVGLALPLHGANPARAADADEDERPRPLDITRQVPEVVAGAVERAEPSDDPSSFTEVIQVDDYRGEVASTAELLSRAVGVQVRRFGGPGDPAEISIRGSTSAQVVIQLDGFRLNTAQSGFVDLSTIPLALLDRIEITRGGGSVQAGSGAIGGVVNLVTLRPGGKPRNRVVGTAGSFDTYEFSVARAATASGLEYVLGYDGFRTDGDWDFERFATRFGDLVVEPVPDEATRINNQSESHAVLVGLGHDVGENGHLSFRDSFFFDSRGMPGLDSGSVGEAGQRAKAHQRRLRNLSALRYEAVDLGRYGLDATVELAYLFERVRFRDVDETPPIATDDRNGALTQRVRLDAEREVAFSSHRASSVFEYRHDTLVSDEFADQRRNSLGVVVQDDIGFFSRRVRVLPALRFDDTESFETEWLPRIGLIVEPAEGVRFKANLEKAYRVPNFDELFFPDKGFIRGNAALEPEESTDGDVGIELDFGRLGPLRDLFFQAAWFHRDIDESIVFVLVNQSLVEPHNTGSATIKGVELAASLGITGWIELSANYTHLDATRDDPDVPLPGRPRNETNLRIEVGPPSRAAKLVLQMQDTDEIPVTDTGGTVLPARTVFDASIALDLARLFPDRSPLGDLTLSLEGKNLTDEIVRDAQFFPQPGRSFAVRLEAEW